MGLLRLMDLSNRLTNDYHLADVHVAILRILSVEIAHHGGLLHQMQVLRPSVYFHVYPPALVLHLWRSGDVPLKRPSCGNLQPSSLGAIGLFHVEEADAFYLILASQVEDQSRWPAGGVARRLPACSRCRRRCLLVEPQHGVATARLVDNHCLVYLYGHTTLGIRIGS